MPTTDEERAQAFRTMIGYSGRYRVDGSTIATKVDVAWNESWVGGEQVGTSASRRRCSSRARRCRIPTSSRVVRVIVTWQLRRSPPASRPLEIAALCGSSRMSVSGGAIDRRAHVEAMNARPSACSR